MLYLQLPMIVLFDLLKNEEEFLIFAKINIGL